MTLFDKTKELEEFIESSTKNNKNSTIATKFEKLKISLTNFFFIAKPIHNTASQYFNYKSKSSGKTEQDKVYALYSIDGDTFIGLHNGLSISFRLASINTPEKRTQWAQEAKILLSNLIDKKEVYITYFGNDKYNRRIVDVFLDPEKKICINDIMIKEGLTHVFNYDKTNKFSTHSFFQMAKKQFYAFQAKKDGKGIWGTQSDFYEFHGLKKSKNKKI